MPALDSAALDQLFTNARTANSWRDEAVDDATIQKLYDLVKMGPTSANCSPARFVFLKSEAAKTRLKPHLSEGNVAKVMTAPVVVIIATDSKFYDRIPELFPHNPGAREWFTGSDAAAAEAAFRNGTLQGGYLIMAARALGLDCGPMSGFNPAGVNAEFFKDTSFHVNFLCALGHLDPAGLFGRLPRLSFESACELL